MTTENLRDKDIAILQAILDGARDVSEIREATTLSTREINYSINEYSLETLELIEVDRTQGREWREYNGQEREIWKPKTLQLTDKATRAIADLDTDQHQYEDLPKDELVERVHEFEDRLNRMENMFKDFRRKVMEQI